MAERLLRQKRVEDSTGFVSELADPGDPEA